MRRRFGVEYTLAGLDLLLHRIGWSVQVPARKATDRDEDRIGAWKDEQWPRHKKDGGGPGRLALLRRRSRPGPEAAQGPHLGPTRPHAGRAGHRRGHQTRLDGGADLHHAPELTPVEGVWSLLKRSLANLTKRNIDQLTVTVKARLKRMQYRPGLIDGLVAKTGLNLQPQPPQLNQDF
ncbi:winged helix-turn-helix domain-containing protein [Streptomyces sp. NPDC057908]|uniref:winged helix-turn-helix domain-containing protein n=1 Tax=Streptomyces sp. NPDC057908 TaxID=3346276 RepID=UPI0036E85BFA